MTLLCLPLGIEILHVELGEDPYHADGERTRSSARRIAWSISVFATALASRSST